MKRVPPNLLVGGVLVGVVVIAALVSVVWTPADPAHVEVSQRFRGPGLAPGPRGCGWLVRGARRRNP